MAARCLKKSGGVPERIFVFVRAENLVAVSPSNRLHFNEAFSRNRNDHAYAMRRVVHRGKPMTPGGEAALVEHETDQSFVMVFRFRIENGPEFLLFSPLTTSD